MISDATLILRKERLTWLWFETFMRLMLEIKGTSSGLFPRASHSYEDEHNF